MKNINQYIDQTILRPEATRQDIMRFLDEVEKYKFYAACVNPCWVKMVRKHLPADTKLCSVVGFPLGASSTKVKTYAAKDLIEMGCDEIDMVMNIGRLKGKDYKHVGKEIRSVVEAAQDRIVKVIIETCLLTDDEKRAATHIVVESGAHFVKTSTGFLGEGARIADVVMLREIVGPDFGVKASGGIRDYDSAVRFIEAGANRLGTSAGVKIVENTSI